MRCSLLAATAALLASPALAQTFTDCNPTKSNSCPPNPALGKTVNIDFKEESDSFNNQGGVSFGNGAASFTVAKQGDNQQLISKWYIMFGRVEVRLKAAPGTGIVSSFVLQSDCLDEIDWEWLGGKGGEVQTMYFGKGNTEVLTRGGVHADPGSQSDFKTYTIEWTPEAIVWQINGETIRTQTAAAAVPGQYPQTPMQIKMGIWAGGDPNNAPGTIEWAGGATDYTKGPFVMQVQSLKVQDYSTGKQYTYGDQTGTSGSIKAEGGGINVKEAPSPIETAAPAITSSVENQPQPFRASVYPWVPDTTMATTASATFTDLPGLPSGWVVSDEGKVVPPSLAASASPPASSTPSSPASSLGSAGASDAAAAASAAVTSGPRAVSNTQNEPAVAPASSASFLRAFDCGFCLLAAFLGVVLVLV